MCAAPGAEAAPDVVEAPPDVGATRVASPRVERLARLLSGASESERAVLVEEFWTEVGRRGAPLVEDIEGEGEGDRTGDGGHAAGVADRDRTADLGSPARTDGPPRTCGEPAHRAVTFLWRGHRATRQVLLLVNRVVDRERLSDALLDRLPGTDVWHLTYRLRADHRASYRMAADISPGELPADPALLQRRLRSLSAYAAHDPLNPARLSSRWGQSDSSVFALPDAPAQPWAEHRGTVPRGRVERHRLPAGALGAERDVWAYLPPGRRHPDMPTVVLCDGDVWFGQLAFQDTLDALIADGVVPPLAVLAPDAVDLGTRWRDLTARDTYVHFLADELLPWAAGRWPLTTDPARTLVAGQSLGGLTALYAGLLRPDRFGAVLAQSASLWWRPGLPYGVPELKRSDELPWLVSRFVERPRPPLRIHLDAGLHEGAMVDHSRALYEQLAARGHPVTFSTYNGGHDYACWRGCLADGLAALL
ncbi:enterochelin esterase [Streptomyces sp. NPDC087300]|uniref:enterochelin esterase n=1 Tax=Streptomyces sp. NPDC087300 TaxID=3365780 RepID=UPI00382E8F20